MFVPFSIPGVIENFYRKELDYSPIKLKVLLDLFRKLIQNNLSSEYYKLSKNQTRQIIIDLIQNHPACINIKNNANKSNEINNVALYLINWNCR